MLSHRRRAGAPAIEARAAELFQPTPAAQRASVRPLYLFVHSSWRPPLAERAERSLALIIVFNYTEGLAESVCRPASAFQRASQNNGQASALVLRPFNVGRAESRAESRAEWSRTKQFIFAQQPDTAHQAKRRPESSQSVSQPAGRLAIPFHYT